MCIISSLSSKFHCSKTSPVEILTACIGMYGNVVAHLRLPSSYNVMSSYPSRNGNCFSPPLRVPTCNLECWEQINRLLEVCNTNESIHTYTGVGMLRLRVLITFRRIFLINFCFTKYLSDVVDDYIGI